MTNPSVVIASSNETIDGDFLWTFSLKAKLLRGNLDFGLVQIYARCLATGKSMELILAPFVRDIKHKRPRTLAELPSDLAAQCAVDRAEDLSRLRRMNWKGPDVMRGRPRGSLARNPRRSRPPCLKGKGEWQSTSGVLLPSYPRTTWTGRIGRECVRC